MIDVWVWGILGGVVWATCGVWAAGYYNAYFQRQYPSVRTGQELLDAVFLAFSGPIGLGVSLSRTLDGDRYTVRGWSLAPDARRPEDFEREKIRWGR